ncbi:MAG TPA: nickel pincer cofactor biosynthesis protein LarB [Chthonomonadaceae bacterium]|nr:nickel pincer cofactor biosynthesis protein LarB [Chthonomonadaceae bacterium]
MDVARLRELLERVQAGTTPVEEALTSLRSLPFEDLGFAKLDHHRALRNGFPEVIYCPGKTTEHILAILERLTAHSRKVLASRATPEVAEAVQAAFPQAVYHTLARMLVVTAEGDAFSPPGNVGALLAAPSAPLQENDPQIDADYRRLQADEGRSAAEPFSFAPAGTVLVVSAGTADLPVAEEAAITAGEMGSPVERLYDVGVAGIHRLLGHQERLFAANVLIVVAGMEGALASVVGGLVARPVVAVPTSVGYGASFHGLSALLTMLNSCATGVGVVNIDNGFGAGYLAHLINLTARSGA